MIRQIELIGRLHRHPCGHRPGLDSRLLGGGRRAMVIYGAPTSAAARIRRSPAQGF
jgi:hypothetical protein